MNQPHTPPPRLHDDLAEDSVALSLVDEEPADVSTLTEDLNALSLADKEPARKNSAPTVKQDTPTNPPLASPSSPGKDMVQCSGIARAGRQCPRKVRSPQTHSILDSTPALYCSQHKKPMLTEVGFYVRGVPGPERFVKFDDYIPKYLHVNTQVALRVEMEKAMSSADAPGYIYAVEIQDPERPDVIQLKVGRTVDLTKRLNQRDKQCGSKVQIPRGWWPGTVDDDDGTGRDLLECNMKAGDPGPFCHRVERLVHIELSDLSLYAPYLLPGWPSEPLPGAGASSPPRKTVAKETTCLGCGAVHKEIFTFRRPEGGRYKGMEWDQIVKPVIEKWGRFVREY